MLAPRIVLARGARAIRVGPPACAPLAGAIASVVSRGGWASVDPRREPLSRKLGNVLSLSGGGGGGRVFAGSAAPRRAVRGSFLLLLACSTDPVRGRAERRDAQRMLARPGRAELAAGEDTGPVACSATSIERSPGDERRLGRTVRVVPPARGAYAFVARSGSVPPAASEAIMRAEGYEMWRVAESEALSLFGQPLARPRLPEAAMRDRLARLAEARAAWERNPADPETWICSAAGSPIWPLCEAIDIYTEGIERFPDDPRLTGTGGIASSRPALRPGGARPDAGERLVSGQPDEIEPDGLPNARNIPTSTLQGNIGYHLGLAHYLKGDLERAQEKLRALSRALAEPRHARRRLALALYEMRRLGRDAERASCSGRSTASGRHRERGLPPVLLLYKGELGIDDLLDPARAEKRFDPAVSMAPPPGILYSGAPRGGDRDAEDLVRRETGRRSIDCGRRGISRLRANVPPRGPREIED